MKLSLSSIATAVPENEFATSDILAKAEHKMSQRFVDSIGRLGIQKRYSVTQNYPDALLDRKCAQLTSGATELGTEAAKSCLTKGNTDWSNIGLLVATTNTQSRLLPGLSSDIVAALNGYLSPTISAINMQGQGCSALLKGLEVAYWYLCVNPNRQVLIVVSEVQTSYLHSKLSAERYFSFWEIKSVASDSDVKSRMLRDTEGAIQAMLFGDGAVALLVSCEDVYPQFFPDSISHLTNAQPQDADLLVMQEGGSSQPDVEGVPQYRMQPAVPQRGGEYAATTVKTALERSSTPITVPQEATACLIHTGSRKILDSVCERLNLSKKSPQVAASYSVLRNYGNLSSASIGFMLANNEWEQGFGLIVSFGIGFSASAGIIEFQP